MDTGFFSNTNINDISYDYYGKRVLTGDSDGNVKVWRDMNGKWILENTIEAHSGQVYKCGWAHPQFGHMIATTGSDGFLNIYEGHRTDDIYVWRRVKYFAHPVDPIRSFDFAPVHLDLRIAGISEAGILHEYKCNSLTGVWSDEVEKLPIQCGRGESISWNTCPFDSPMLVVGVGNTAIVCEFAERADKWISVCQLPGHNTKVTSVSWCPSSGKSFHLIATGCRAGYLRIYKYYSRGVPAYTATGSGVYGEGTPVAMLHSTLSHNNTIGLAKVEWDITGSCIVTSGDDGSVHIWKQDFTGVFNLHQ